MCEVCVYVHVGESYVLCICVCLCSWGVRLFWNIHIRTELLLSLGILM